MSIMAGTSLKDSAKSVGLMVCSPLTKANTNDIRVLRNPAHSNFRGSNNKKKKRPSCNRSIRCHGYTANDKRMLQASMYRRQLLLASTSLPLKPQQILEAIPPPPNLTDYHKLANAVQETQKFKNSPHGHRETNDVVCWLSSSEALKPSNIYKSPDELSGIVAVPPAQELLRQINEKELLTARVRRPAELKDKEEQLVLQGIEVTNDKPLCFEVYIKLGIEEENDEEEEIYLATFGHMPPRPKERGRHNNKAASDGREEQKRVRRCCLRLGMNDMLSEAESVIVKLAPTMKVEEDPIMVESIFIDYM